MGNTHNKMIRNKHAFRGVNCALLAFIAIIWSAIFAPAILCAQRVPAKVEADSLSRRQTSYTPLQILSGQELENK